MNVYCLECGCKLRFFTGRWIALNLGPCVSATHEHLPDPLDIALRRLNEAKDAVREARNEVIVAQAQYDMLKIIRTERKSRHNEDHP